MTASFKVPERYQESFRRLTPYMAAPLHKDPEVFESILLFLKLGGERLARVVVDAYNVSQRQLEIEMMRQLREEAFYEEQLESSDEDDSDDMEDEDLEDQDDNHDPH